MFSWLFEQGFMPHGHCYFWRSDILWMHVLSDSAIALAYFSIPCTLLYFIGRRRDVPRFYQVVLVLFASFIVLCGFTHVLSIITVWNPIYAIDGVAKAITAVVSVVTATALVPLVPQALAMRSPAELQAINDKLTDEVTRRQEVEVQLKQAVSEVRNFNSQLESRVLARTAELEAANKDLEGFSYSVSHDLRAPLRAIDNFSGILQEEYADRLDEEGQRLFKVVRDNAGKMGRMIDDILEFSRAGSRELDLTGVDLAKLAQVVFEEVAASESKSAAAFEVETMPVAFCDAGAIRQVLTNLISNAIKFSSKKDKPEIRLSAEVSESEHIYTITDNGAGFDARYADKLFGVFQRLHSSTEFEGTGIGLAIVKRIIEKHGGRVWAESDPDGGTRFHFSLPTENSIHAAGGPE